MHKRPYHPLCIKISESRQFQFNQLWQRLILCCIPTNIIRIFLECGINHHDMLRIPLCQFLGCRNPLESVQFCPSTALNHCPHPAVTSLLTIMLLSASDLVANVSSLISAHFRIILFRGFTFNLPPISQWLDPFASTASASTLNVIQQPIPYKTELHAAITGIHHHNQHRETAQFHFCPAPPSRIKQLPHLILILRNGISLLFRSRLLEEPSTRSGFSAFSASLATTSVFPTSLASSASSFLGRSFSVVCSGIIPSPCGLHICIRWVSESWYFNVDQSRMSNIRPFHYTLIGSVCFDTGSRSDHIPNSTAFCAYDTRRVLDIES